jgi:hypothetical protein
MSEQSSSTNVTDVNETGAEVEETEQTGQVEGNEPEGNEDDEVEEYSDLTPYAASKVALRVLPGSKQTEQTYYGYARSGRIESNYQQWLADGGKKSGYKVKLNGAAFMQYLKDVKSGKITTTARNDYDALADEFALEDAE